MIINFKFVTHSFVLLINIMLINVFSRLTECQMKMSIKQLRAF